jgi:phosphoenolpyruvate synthase/pyruvate phosphate dikinase
MSNTPLTSPLTLNLGDVGCEDVPQVGGKAAALSALAAAGLPVPAGFVVTAAAFACGSAAGAEVADEVVRRYRQLGEGEPVVAVRSSAIDEDGLTTSFAGQHETRLGVRGPEALLAAIASVQASLHSERASTYRERHSIGSAARGIAVLVQRMVDARTAGVMFAADLHNGESTTLLIEAAWGLGEAVVDGSVTPDRFVVDKLSGERRRMEIADKRVMTVLEGSGTAVVDVAPARRTLPCLSAGELRRIAALADDVERVRGGDCDIEWAIDDEAVLHLLQARPITTSIRGVG